MQGQLELKKGSSCLAGSDLAFRGGCPAEPLTARSKKRLVPGEGIEPLTFGLQNLNSPKEVGEKYNKYAPFWGWIARRGFCAPLVHR
ncbi:MAG TPA: hypothetical protein PLV46_24145 [Reyranella sp.]|jgi:hypothetical protein|uniref:hypothetical protein n=1 Tax=Reyranella sp. TaxID=1929291 RepID=UPI002BA9F1D0|nr:hypothetical protein [Reyranella sp.]HQS17992.1 hypothetical protein [Reyranella sp.]HQT14567.1 hypothetical protein [Reyranella sp.]